jgi:glycosyltransferase involved in cell wall biosynthesis
MRILLITSDKYPPHRPAAKVIFGRELVSRGHDIDWLIQAEADQPQAARIPLGRGTVYIAATNDGRGRFHRLRKHWLGLRNDLRMVGLSRRRRYDVIQVKDKYLAALPALVMARLTGAAFVYWLAYPHGEASLNHFSEGTARYRWIYWLRGHAFRILLYRVLLPGADHVFVQSEQMKRDIASQGIDPEIMTPVPGSVDLDDIPYEAATAFETPEATDEEISLVYLGTLDRARRLDFLLRVHGKVLLRYPRARLYMVGSGHTELDEDLLRREVEQLGLQDSVVFTGHLPMRRAWEHIRRARVCVSPYYPTYVLNSTSPTKLIEYMAMARPVVGNDHPEQSLVIHESGAGLCVPWDESAFADAICRILAAPQDWEPKARGGRRYVETKRTNAVMAGVVEQAYERVRTACEQGRTHPAQTPED